MTEGEALDRGWEAFCDAVKHKTRFLFFPSESHFGDEHEPYLVRPSQMMEKLGDLILDLNLVRPLPAGMFIYRARGYKKKGTLMTPVELGPPPKHQARTAGRMNAPGIVTCYAALEAQTALTEATGDWPLFKVAKFRLLRDMTVIDLVDFPSIPSFFEGDQGGTLSFLHRFVSDVSQPFEPDDRLHIEYVPTQVISEYLRHRFLDRNSNKVDGLLYRSAKTSGGINLALFIDSEEVLGASSERIFPPAPKLELVNVGKAVRQRS